MTEVEKMYENAGVEPLYKKRIECKDDYKIGYPCDKGIACINCNRSVFEDVMPPFTAERQLEITKFIGLHYGFQMLKNEAFDYVIATRIYVKYEYEYKGYGYGYDVAIANLINNLWQDLTESEQEQIRSILNG